MTFPGGSDSAGSLRVTEAPREADTSAALWLREAGGAAGGGLTFDLHPGADLRVVKPGRPRPLRRQQSSGERRGGGLWQEEAEFGGLGGPQGSGPGSSPFPRLSSPSILCSLGDGGGGEVGAVRGVRVSGGAGGSWRRSRASGRQWFLVVLAGGVKYL